jgi:hypothetical protein
MFDRKIIHNKTNGMSIESSLESNGGRIGGEGDRVSTTSSKEARGRGSVGSGALATYWMLTIPHQDYTPYDVPGVSYCKGQLEKGKEDGYLHWQLFVILPRQQRLSYLKKLYGSGIHAEPTRSKAAEDYVWKEDTRVEGTQFELGTRPLKRNCATDWDEVLRAAKSSRFEDIPSDIYVRYYGNLKRISVENAQPVGILRTCTVYWGSTGTGKSRTAWEEAGNDAYPKDPCSKFWDGYRGQNHVVIDEFRGIIGIAHLLRWLDRYPVLVEVKGSSTVFKAEKIWITSNLHPREWYKDVDELTVEALLRRLTVVELN